MTLKTSIFTGIALATLAITWRLINYQLEIAPNLELVTVATLLAATFLDRRVALLVPLIILAVSDQIIGNSTILIFTWSAWFMLALAGLLLRGLSYNPKTQLISATGLAVGGSIFFFVYTNFGVWITGNFYPHTLAGLASCYLMGVPFYRTMLLGNLIIVPFAFGIVAFARSRNHWLVGRTTTSTDPR